MAARNIYDAHHLFFNAKDANAWFHLYRFD